MKKNIKKTIFILNGLSGVGKSYIGKLLSKKLKIPLISVDNIIKERIFDSKLYVCKSKKQKQSLVEVHLASLNILTGILNELAKNNISLICEYVFPNDFAVVFNLIKEKYKYYIVFINIKATFKKQLKSRVDRESDRHFGRCRTKSIAIERREYSKNH